MEADEGPVAAPEIDLRQEGASRPIGPREHRVPRPRHSARVTASLLAHVEDAVLRELRNHWLIWLAVAGLAALVVAVHPMAVANVASGLSLIPIGLGVFEGAVTLLMMSAGVAPGEAAAAGPAVPRVQ
jgi:hypothetical protein